MEPMTVSQQASALLRAYGPVADAKVAEKIRACEAGGDDHAASDWRRVQDAIRERRRGSAA